MKMPAFHLSATRALALAGLFAASLGAQGALSAQGAALFTLKGEAFDARDPGQSEVRLSVIAWTGTDQLGAIETEYQAWTGTQDHVAFDKFLQQRGTMGYLFTKAATGHTIKYAWQDEQAKRMVLLVTPALKSRTPNMWKHPNTGVEPFSLVEVRFDGDEAVMKSSLEAAIATSAAGRLQLQDYDAAPEFGRLRDATPYYLKN